MESDTIRIMTRGKKIIILAAAVISAVMLAVAAGLILTRTLDLETYRAELIQTIKTELNRDVRFARGVFSFWFRPAFTFEKVVILEKDSQAIFIAADRLSFKLSLLPLLRKKIVLREVLLDNPRMTLVRDVTGAFNVSDLLDEKKQDVSFGIRRLNIRNGTLRFFDHRALPETLMISLERIDLRLGRLERGKAANFSLNASVVDAEKNGTIALEGSIEIPEASESLLSSRIDAAVKVQGLNADRYWPYYSRHVPFRKLTGQLDIDARFRGNARQFESEGSVTMHALHFDYPSVFHAPLMPKKIHAVYDMRLDPHDIALTRLDVSVDGVHIRGSCLLKDLQTDDPLIDAKASTTEIHWESFSHFIPYGIIPKPVADFIEQKIKSGNVRLDEGRLYGRVSRIARMEKGDNSDALHIRGRVRQGVLEYAPGVPVFSDISGILELRGKDFILRDMAGKFGDAPFKLDAKLADYCLETPTRYPLTFKMSPTAREVAWLFAVGSAKKIHLSGASQLSVSGDGSLANYSLSGSWDLSSAAYQYADWLAKPAAKANHLHFEMKAKPQEISFPSIRFDLPPLSLTATARYRHTGRHALSLTVDTNPVQVADLAPLLPKIGKFAPRGKIKLAVKARSGPKDPADLSWRGEIALIDVSFRPLDSMKPLSHLTGKIRLRGDKLETSKMTARLGSAVISVRGEVLSLREPSLSVTFSSEQVDLSDLGLRHPEESMQVRHVKGSIVIKNGDMQIDALTFQINDSELAIKGGVKNVQDQPEARLRVSSSYLDGQDILRLGDLKWAEKTGKPTAGLFLDAAVQANAGRMGRLAFEKLQTNVMLEKNILYLKNISFGALGGKLTGNSRIDLIDAESPRYQFDFNLNRLSSEQCLAFLEMKEKFITGAFSAKGGLTTKGTKGLDLKKTALGNVRIQIEDGMLTRFEVLSKIFSILNVSQLLKFQLPDMVHGGMPYSKITATLSFRDGMVSTRDLFIHSNAMNISAVAAIDMPEKKFVDTVVGVQPLQTLDKAVSLIPVVGWILTDENRSIMTVYFEVKGNLENPSVTAIPVKAMARGVFDIFKNIFQLPAKLFTDTGEVIFGREKTPPSK